MDKPRRSQTWRAALLAAAMLHGLSAHATITPNTGTTLAYPQYEALTPALTLNAALQQFSAYSNYLSERRIDYQASRNSSTGTDFSKENQTYRFVDSQCQQLDLQFDSSGNLAGKHGFMPLPDALTSSKLTLFDDSISATLTLDQARQWIGSTGAQTGQSYLTGNGGSDSIWRWEQSNRQANIELNFMAGGGIGFLSQWQNTTNTSTALAPLYPRLQPGMSIADVRQLLGSNGSLAAKSFAPPNVTNFIPTVAYFWRDPAGNSIRVEFNGNTLSWSQANGPAFTAGNTLAVAPLVSSDIKRITLGSTADTVIATFGRPNAQTAYNIDYRDAEGNALFVWLNPDYLPPVMPVMPTMPILKVSGAGQFQRCVAAAPVQAKITGTSGGGLSNHTLVAEISAAQDDLGKAGQLYILTILPNANGVLALSPSKGWQFVTSTTQIPAYASVTLAKHSIPVLDGSVDLAAVPGIRFFAAYALAGKDLLTTGKITEIDQVLVLPASPPPAK